MDSPIPSFPEPWHSVGPEQAEELLREARAEISPGHPLHGMGLVPVAQSRLADDVLFKLPDGRVAAVHLTWQRGPEVPPWPSCKIFASFDGWAEQVMIPDSEPN